MLRNQYSTLQQEHLEKLREEILGNREDLSIKNRKLSAETNKRRRWVPAGGGVFWAVERASEMHLFFCCLSFMCFFEDGDSRPGHKILSKFQAQGQVAIFIFKTRTKYPTSQPKKNKLKQESLVSRKFKQQF